MAHQPDYPVHPAADLFPMLGQAELAALGEDIARSGQRFPIQLWAGTLVDGRNRLAACRLVGISPTVDEVDFNSEAECVRFIISNNIHRRHLDPKRMPAIAAELATMMRGRPSDDIPSNEGIKKSVAEVAAQLGTSVAQVERAKEVKAKAPDLFQKMKAGEMKTGTAHREMKARVAKASAAPVTNPDNADDAVVEKKIETAASGYTPKMEKVWAGYAALDAVEQTAFRERMNG